MEESNQALKAEVGEASEARAGLARRAEDDNWRRLCLELKARGLSEHSMEMYPAPLILAGQGGQAG